MMRRAAFADNGTAPGQRVHFRCPGCDDVHGVTVGWSGGWGFNDNLDRPTFTPSVLVQGGPNDTVCHSFVTDGRIQFLTDSTHVLAGQTVDLPEWKP